LGGVFGEEKRSEKTLFLSRKFFLKKEDFRKGLRERRDGQGWLQETSLES